MHCPMEDHPPMTDTGIPNSGKRDELLRFMSWALGFRLFATLRGLASLSMPRPGVSWNDGDVRDIKPDWRRVFSGGKTLPHWGKQLIKQIRLVKRISARNYLRNLP